MPGEAGGGNPCGVDSGASGFFRSVAVFLVGGRVGCLHRSCCWTRTRCFGAQPAIKALSKKVRRLIEDDTFGVFLSAATAWVIATKVRLGKLVWGGADSVEAYCAGQRFELLPVSFAHAERAGSCPRRMVIPLTACSRRKAQLIGLPSQLGEYLYGIALLRRVAAVDYKLQLKLWLP